MQTYSASSADVADEISEQERTRPSSLVTDEKLSRALEPRLLRRKEQFQVTSATAEGTGQTSC